MIIAIDGPAGAGKGTLGKMLASQYHYAFLDTGLLYRAVAQKALENQVAFHDILKISEIANEIFLGDLDEKALKTPEISQGASQVATLKEVRAILLSQQRNFAAERGQQGGAILDGRDIGTHVLPHADLKFFITASLEERALRRYKELQSTSSSALSLKEVYEDVRQRDERDTQRAENALRPADDAIIVDTTTLSIDKAFHVLCHFVDSKLS